MTLQDLLLQGIEKQNQGDAVGAAALFGQVLQQAPNDPHALYSLALIRLNEGHLGEAARLCAQGTQANQGFAPLWYLYANVLQSAGDKENALRCYDNALVIDPTSQEVLLNSGALLRGMFRHKEALERFNQILTLNPNHAAALGNCGILLTEFKQSDAAIGMFRRLLEVQADYEYGLGLLLYEQMHICDWSGWTDLRPRIIDGVRAGQRVCKSLAFMAISDDARDHQTCARIFAQHHNPPRPVALWQGERYRHRKIRIAYISPDLREHPVGHLMAGVFEHHDKNRFETIALSLGIDDGSRLRARMLQAFDQFIDVRDQTSLHIAQLMRSLEVDIAVDLGGYTSDTRTDLFSYHAAPVQVNYLGYPGTMGVGYYDYILADPHIIPPEQQHCYDEKVVYLPDTYLPTDNSVQIAERTPTRAECGLPDEGVVFCSFSHDYKITPYMFDIWMRLLHQVPGSALWLVSRGEAVRTNLRKEAQARGIDPARLVFAERVPRVEDHLARYRQATLFLDTHPYNAHTTAADALMAGLPVVTCMGNAFPSRVAGGLVCAAGVPELATHSLEEYEALALKLALDPQALQDVKARIVPASGTNTLLDTEGFCRHLEAAYTAMWRAQQLGNAKDALRA
ncbi:MAG: O-linked N-acetylglucosamine transferase, SPINDLY family protein [Rhodoferax sp.]